MKSFKKTLGLLLALALASCVLVGCTKNHKPKEQREPTYNLTVMSYNIRTFAIEDSPAGNGWESRHDRVVSQIVQESPDVLGCQEVTIVHEATLRKEAKLAGYEIIMDYRQSTPEGLMFLYKKERFELVEAKKFWLSETPEEASVGWDASMERIGQLVTLKDKESGEIFNFINIHYDHRGTVAQKQSSQVVKEYLKESMVNFVFGDFNIEKENEGYVALAESLNDVKYVATKTMDEVTYNAYGKESQACAIDHIFVSKTGVDVLEYKVLNEFVDGKYASDHYAVIGKFSYNAKKLAN